MQSKDLAQRDLAHGALFCPEKDVVESGAEDRPESGFVKAAAFCDA